MKIHSFLVLLFGGYALCTVINHVRLVDHISYAINVITQTVNVVEDRGWCNLKLPDYIQQLNETILNTPVKGNLTYTDGFVSSIQRMDIQQNTVQQVWSFNASAVMTHTVTVRGTLRMHDVAVGYDVIANLEGDDENYRYTTVHVHPLISFAFSIIKDVNRDTLSVTVVGSVPATTRVPEYRPKDSMSDIFTATYNAVAISSAGMIAWGPEVFQPITYELVTKNIQFPTICYNCAVS